MKKPIRDYRQLQQIIVGLSEGVILVGTDRRIIWANDAALVLHGVAQMGELGRTATEYRRRFELSYRNLHRLEPDRYPMDRLLAGERLTNLTVNVTCLGHPERSFVHALRSLVVTDSEDNPECFALIVRDETGRYEAEARFESAFNANPAPALICRLSDRRYVKVNPGFLEMTGYAREEIIGTSMRDIDVLAAAEKRDLAFARLEESKPIPQMEACLPVAGGLAKFVILAGEPIEIAEEACILFTFADLDPRKRIEQTLRQSEERFAKSFRLSPAPTAICNGDALEIMEVNEAFMEMSGFSMKELVGRPAAALSADKATWRGFEQVVREVGSTRNFDLPLRARDDTRIDCLVSADSVTINDEPCVLCVMQDITDRKRSESELIDAIETVMADTSWFGRAIVEKLAALRRISSAQPPSAGLDQLTSREREVLGLICQGQSDKEMGSRLKLSPNTIRNHVSSLYLKIGVKRRSAAVIWGRERGITGREGLNGGRASGR